MSIKIQLNQPCSENWETFSKVSDTTRFCGACQHNVVDFSDWSDQEIKEYFLASTGRVCGRFSTHQLNRPLVPERAPRFTFSRLAAAWIGGGVSLLGIQAHAQHQVPVEIVQELPSDTAREAVAATLQETHLKFKGKAMDDNGCAIVAEVSIVGTDWSTTTDEEGNYELTIDKRLIQTEDIRLKAMSNLGRVDLEQFVTSEVAKSSEHVVDFYLRELRLGGAYYIIAKPVIVGPLKGKWLKAKYTVQKWFTRNK